MCDIVKCGAWYRLDGYVAISRGRYDAQIYRKRREGCIGGLRHCAGTAGSQMLAHDVTEGEAVGIRELVWGWSSTVNAAKDRKPFVTPEEAARFLRISPVTVKKMAREGYGYGGTGV